MKHLKLSLLFLLTVLPLVSWGKSIIPWGRTSPWEMKYVFQENDEGVPPADDSNGKAWYDIGYDDADWGTLSGPICRDDQWGLGDDNFFHWENEYGCFYLRCTFNVNLSDYNTDNLFVKYTGDDYVEVYINGIEVSHTEDNFDMTTQLPSDVLVDGENTLAIYINDSGGGDAYLDYTIADASDDISFFSPYQDEQGVWYEYNEDNEEWEVIGHDWWTTDFVIPATIMNAPVTVIREGVFGDGSCGSIILPEGLRSIGYMAFHHASFTSLTIPASVEDIGSAIIYGCQDLTELIVDEGNTVYDSRDNCNAIIKTEENKIIASCPTTIIPESVTIIGYQAFMGSTFAETIIPEHITLIEDMAYSECLYLSKVTVKFEIPIEIEGDPFPDRFDQFLYVPAGCKEAFEQAAPWNEFAVIVEEGEELVYPSVGYVRQTDTDEGTTLTFVYDNLFYPSRENGETVYSLKEIDGEPEWYANGTCGGVTRVVIDESFADARPTLTHSWFREMPITSIEGLEYLNTSEVTSMNAMFYCSTEITSLDLSTFDTSKIEDTDYILYDCHSLRELTLPLGLSRLNDNSCIGIGSEEYPCLLNVPDGFDFGGASVSGSGFNWKGGWFYMDIDYSDATADNPANVSFLINNPTFTNNNHSGWSGDGWGAYDPQENVEHYYKTYDTYQDITGLLEGVYKVSVNAFYRAGNAQQAYDNYKAQNEQSKYAKLYASTSAGETETSIASPFSAGLTQQLSTGNWSTATDEETNNTFYIPNNMRAADEFFKAGYCNDNEVLIAVTDGNLRIGVRKNNTVNNDWSIFDDFSLVYYGSGSDAVALLRDSYLENLETVDLTDVLYTNEYLTAYEAAVNALNSATTLKEAYAAIIDYQTALEELKENINLWKQLTDLLPQATEAAADTDYMESYRDKCTQWIENDYPNLTSALAATNEELAEEIAKVTAMIDDVYHHPAGEDVDMTNLLVNPNFTDYEDGWTKEAAHGGNVAAGGLKNNPCFEAWNNANFDIYQNVENAPKGVYGISVQGFYRYGRNEFQAYLNGEQYTTKETCPVFVYMNNNATPFTNIYGDPKQIEDPEFYRETNDYSSETLPDGTVVYFPNGMLSASVAFAAGMYTQAAYGLVANDGDIIRIGVKGCTNQLGDSWSIWDNFKITYCGFKIDVMRPLLEEAIAEAENELNNAMGSDIAAELQAAINEGKAVVDGEDGEAMFNALTILFDLKEPVGESEAIFATLVEANEELAAAIENAVASDDIKDEANALVASINEGMTNHIYADSDVEGLIQDILTMHHRLGIPENMAEATALNPVECTTIIFNPTYDSGNDDGWMGEAAISGSALNAEKYNTTFNYYQELSGLPEGTYRVVLQGFYRAGGYDEDYINYVTNPDDNNNALLYTTVGETTNSTSLKRLASEAQVMESLPNGWVWADEANQLAVPNWPDAANEAFNTDNSEGTAKLYSGNTVTAVVGEDGKLTIGVRKDVHVDYDWTIWDNWQLFYLGKSIIGDANGDGEINITDVSIVVDYILTDNTEFINLDNADVNGDGIISIADVTCLVEIILSE